MVTLSTTRRAPPYRWRRNRGDMMNYPAALILAFAALALAACNGLYGDDQFAHYVQRADKITLSAGDAKEVNIATQTIHPWPPGVGDPRIAANGERMVRAID